MRIDLDKDVFGWRPPRAKVDKPRELVEDRIYNQPDMDRTLILENRTRLVARRITEYFKGSDRFDQTIVFCEEYRARRANALRSG